jgi:uncharacterized membrane protein YhaH (DUF805 family)
MNAKDTYWFPARRFGWGWGAPTRWQGWLVLGTFVLVMGIGSIVLIPQQLAAFLCLTLLTSALLLIICYAKGEPPAWRWGDRP